MLTIQAASSGLPRASELAGRLAGRLKRVRGDQRGRRGLEARRSPTAGAVSTGLPVQRRPARRGGLEAEQSVLLVSSGEIAVLRRPAVGFLEAHEAFSQRRWLRSAVYRRALSPQARQWASWGAADTEGGAHFKPAERRAAAASWRSLLV